MQNDQSSVLNNIIRSRRSVFPDQFIAGKKIDDEIIKDIITNALCAPNHGQTEPWKFTVFTGGGLQKLADLQSSIYKETAGDKFSQSKFEKLQQTPLKASHIVAIQMLRTTTKNIPEIEDIEAVACAVQNLALSVHAYGLGGYWTSGGITYNDKGKSFFGLGEQDRLLGFFYIGEIAIPSPSKTRKSLEEKLDWVV